MSDELVRELREGGDDILLGNRLYGKAADRIESLSRELERALRLLQEWADDFGCGCNADACTMCKTRVFLAALPVQEPKT